VISTFAGGGGSSTGYMMAGFRELLAVEWDDNAVQTLRLNYPHLDIYHGDIAKLSVEEVLRRTGLQPGELDVFDGSPPCQGFSTAGKRDFDDDRNQLFREYVRLLRGLQPKVFVMENVSGMVKGKMKLIFVEILKELKASGYKVSARLLNAMYFHVPQSRERMIFIGVRNDLGVEPSHPKAESRPIGLIDAIRGLPSDWSGDIRRYAIGAEWAKLKIGEKSTKYLSLVKPKLNNPCPTLTKGAGE
jgi:DNA (cytosine-5)-methyltransferase 1